MKSLFLALVGFWLCLTPAHAQNPTCPTRPPGDSTNACASTAFVTNTAGITVSSNAGLVGINTSALAAGTSAWRTGYYAAGDGGRLLYTFSTSACSLFSGAGDGGSQIKPTTGGGCWLASFEGDPTTAQFGSKGDGVTNDTTAVQNAWNYAASVGRNVYLRGTNGSNLLISSITGPTPTTGEFGNRSALIGAGSGVTKVTSNVTGTNCAISLNATYASNSDYNATFSGFSLVSSGTPAVNGKGLCMTNVTNINFNDIWFTSFIDGVFAADSIRITWQNDWWLGNTTGVHTLFISNSHPNAWVFINPQVFQSGTYGMLFVNSTDINIFGGDWENNGIGNASAVTLYMLGNPIDGTKGLNISGGYFSGNNGIADILIDPVTGGSTLNGAHSINALEMDRVGNTNIVTNPILISNSGSTGVTNVSIRGNGFAGFGGYTPNASRQYVAISLPSSANIVVDSGGNFFQSPTEYPNGQWFKELPWATYTPTFSCGAGAVTSATPTGRYKNLGNKTLAVNLGLTITTNGTCASFETLTLPAPAAVGSGAGGRDIITSFALSGQVPATSTLFTFVKYDGTYAGINGSQQFFNFVYETQ